MKYSCYREILLEEFEKKKKINPSFSLRAFAQKLDLSPSRISEILNGKQGLSVLSAKKIALKLSFSSHRQRYFQLLVQKKHARSIKERERANQELDHLIADEIKHLPHDQYEGISAWYHYALLEVLKTEGVVHSIKWLAKRFNLTEKCTQLALLKLKKLSLIGEMKGKYFLKEGKAVTTISPVPSHLIRKHHENIVNKSLKALHEQELDQREFNSLILAINERDQKEIIKKIRDFFHEINREYTYNEGPKTKVYALSGQFFELGEKI